MLYASLKGSVKWLSLKERKQKNKGIRESGFLFDCKNRFAMVRIPGGTTFSYGLCSKCTDLAEMLRYCSRVSRKHLLFAA